MWIVAGAKPHVRHIVVHLDYKRNEQASKLSFFDHNFQRNICRFTDIRNTTSIAIEERFLVRDEFLQRQQFETAIE
jgi:hypothetical protein